VESDFALAWITLCFLYKKTSSANQLKYIGAFRQLWAVLPPEIDAIPPIFVIELGGNCATMLT
jgi:hypothetical protein